MRLCRPMVRPKPLRIDPPHRLVEVAALPGGDVEQGAEPFAPRDPRSRRSGSGSAARTALRPAPVRSCIQRSCIAARWPISLSKRGPVDDRPDIGARIGGSPTISASIAPVEHLERPLGDILLQHEQAQGRAALAGRAEGRSDDVLHHLLGERGGIDDHRVDAAGLGDQRDDRRGRRRRAGCGRCAWRSRSSR